MREKLVKISRYGESFWVRDVHEAESDVFVGVVDTDLDPDNRFRCGDIVPFAACEILEVANIDPRVSS